MFIRAAIETPWVATDAKIGNHPQLIDDYPCQVVGNFNEKWHDISSGEEYVIVVEMHESKIELIQNDPKYSVLWTEEIQEIICPGNP